ncbi:MAG: hypothetical protein NW216_00765 [Hyphomicrobium sp.]|nr:hypothetical protein [Hyphomicrobium sp.]
MIKRFLLSIAMASIIPAAASAETLSADDLQKTFAGKTIGLSTPFGSLPISYSSGGTMVARSRAMQIYSGHYEDRGTWRIAGNRFCQRWNIWYKGKEQCFTVRRAGSTLKWTSNDGMSGTAYASR